MRRLTRIGSAVGATLLTAALAAGCSSSGSEPAAQAQGTSSAPPQPTPGQTCLTPGSDPRITGLPACDTQAPDNPPSPTASPDGFHRLTFSHQPGPVPQAPTVTLTRADGVKVGLTLWSAQATSGAHARIGFTVGGKDLASQTVAEGDNVTEAGYTFHIIKIWVMSTAATDAVDLTATPAG